MRQEREQYRYALDWNECITGAQIEGKRGGVGQSIHFSLWKKP